MTKQSNDRRTRTLLGTAVVAAGLIAPAGPAAAQEPTEAPEKASGREHVVRRGDTLWDLASFYLSNHFLWGLIYEANRGVVEDPHWIYPAERLIIPGLPPAQRDAAAAAAVPGEAAVEGEAPPAPPAAKASEPQRTRFYRRPEGPTPAEAPVSGGDPERLDLMVPQVRPGEFYAAPWLDSPDRLVRVGQVVSVAGRRALESRISETVHPYDRIYLRYAESAPPQVGDRLLLVQPGREVDDWGRVIEPMAIATVAEVDEETMTAVVDEQFGRLEEGAYALPLEPYPGLVEMPPQPVETGPQGRLIAFEASQPLPSPRDRAFIDLGREDGLEVGDELVAYVPPRGAPGSGVTLPSEEVARLRVLRVAERSATVQVVRLEQPTLRAGLPVRLIAKRP